LPIDELIVCEMAVETVIWKTVWTAVEEHYGFCGQVLVCKNRDSESMTLDSQKTLQTAYFISSPERKGNLS
ncbi:hypothetical protein STEG23_030609, partial [Scotinomys teguina]